ncbi:MAG: HNH endonuclease [Planctomycetes bacterium]|nr:HNH endonuclease [Planctomycetota bacterium]
MKMRHWGESLLIVRSRFYCSYCGVDLLSHPRLFESLTLDHFVPRSRGGVDAEENRVVCCAACDRWKRSYQPTSIEDARALLADIRVRTMPHLERYIMAFRQSSLVTIGGAV